jgi:hypothetical protein
LRQNGRTEAVATGQVEYTTVADQLRCPEISVHVLVDDLNVGRPWHAPLAGPLDQSRRPAASTDGHGAHLREPYVTMAVWGGRVATIDLFVHNSASAW